MIKFTSKFLKKFRKVQIDILFKYNLIFQPCDINSKDAKMADTLNSAEHGESMGRLS